MSEPKPNSPTHYVKPGFQPPVNLDEFVKKGKSELDGEQLLNKYLPFMQKYLEDPTGWTKYRTVEGTEVFSRNEPGSSFACWKLEATVDAEANALADGVTNSSMIGQLDHTTEITTHFQTFDNGTWMTYTLANPGFPFYYRDFVDFNFRVSLENPTRVVFGTASLSDHLPGVPRAVRGHIHIWGYRLECLPDGKTKLTLVSQTDLGGWMPAWIVNRMVVPVLVDYVNRLTKVVQEASQKK